MHPSNSDHVLAQAGTTAGNLRTTVEHGEVGNGGRTFTRILHADFRGTAVLEQWIVHGGGHAWSGGSPEGSYTDSRGPDASRAMLRFFFDHPAPGTILPEQRLRRQVRQVLCAAHPGTWNHHPCRTSSRRTCQSPRQSPQSSVRCSARQERNISPWTGCLSGWASDPSDSFCCFCRSSDCCLEYRPSPPCCS